MSTTIYTLVGCGKAKHEGTLPAKDKYSSNYFELKRKYAEALSDEWGIVSAEYGLIHPDEKIDDYDTTVANMSADEREIWGDKVGSSLIERIKDIGYHRLDEVHVLLGQQYQEPIPALHFVDEFTTVDVVYPFEDTSGIGEQMTVLKTAATVGPDHDG